MINTLITRFKENPLETVSAVAVLLLIFFALYLGASINAQI
jgi:hypothetical protein